MTRVAIIGAGPCGLGQLRSFVATKDKGGTIPEIVCFEKQDDWGGLWNYTWRVGLDEHGDAVHGSMYRYLWSNGPKECLEFADYPFEKHFGKAIPSFPPREVLYDYIIGRANESNLRPYIRFGCAVRRVVFEDESRQFAMSIESFADNAMRHEKFDYVIVAAGHFSTPNIPHLDGAEGFPGRIMHAHDFRSAEEFAGKDLLVIGASYSAEDIALQCHKYGAKSVTMSYRTAAMGFQWPETMEERPLLAKLDGKTAHFQDGSKKRVDAVILCTGYQHHFPFMDDNLRLRCPNVLYPGGLYKGLVWNDNPRLMYLGMQDQWYTFSMFDLQAWYARDIIMGKIKIPAKELRSDDIAKWRNIEDNLEDAYQMIDFQADYMQDLHQDVDYPAFDLDLTRNAFKTWKKDKGKSIVNYRNSPFKSPVTGTMAPSHHTSWLEAMDDSMECFMGEK